MKRKAVESSNVASIGHDADTNVLEVEFKPDRSGRARVYQYTPVLPAVFERMCQPGVSIGRTLHERVKRDPAVIAVDVTPEAAR